MSEIDFKKEDISWFSKFLNLGFYRVNHEGHFIECDAKAREIFGIPRGDTDLSGYSIKELYVVPQERAQRIDKLIRKKSEPLCGTLYLKIKGENKIVLDICRYSHAYTDGGNFIGFVSPIEESTLSPKMFNNFPMGLYEVNEEDRIVRVNNKFARILRYKNKEEILEMHFTDFFEDKEEFKKFNWKIRDHGFAYAVLRLRDALNKIIEVECFSQLINDFGDAYWGMINDVTERERAVRAVDRMPTGFYHIEYQPNDPTHEHDRLTQCNDCYARILGLENKEALLRENITKYFYPDKEENEKLFKALEEKDKISEPLRNHTFKTRTITNETIYVAADVHLVKDSEGNVIGREGTIRDITEKIKLEKQVQETHKRLSKTTTDINKFINNFLHPVVKFSGNLELSYQMIAALNQTVPAAISQSVSNEELANTLMDKLIQIKERLLDKRKPRYGEEIKRLPLVDFQENLTRIINRFHHSLSTEKSKILLGSAVRDTALWTLEQLNKIDYRHNPILIPLIKNDFIEFLQGILLYHLEQSSQMLVNETKLMKTGVEALGKYIAMRKERQYSFSKHDLGKILVENTGLFKPVFAGIDMEIELKYKGNLWAEISRHDIDRVIGSLLDNAKKYSYRRKGSFVRVKARELQPQNQVEVSIENFGIPIKKEELQDNAIMEYGFRGKFAYTCDRDGLGLGLADAGDVVEAHHGEILITSEPVAHDGDPPEYKVPYRTTVIISIPKKRTPKE